MPQVSQIRTDLATGTRVVPRRTDDLDGSLAVAVDDPARGHRMGMMVPIEGDRWVITVGGFHGDVPSTDQAAFARFARSLPTPALADVLDRTDDTSPVVAERAPTSQRRHVEWLDRTPAGFVVLGDAIANLNPIHGHGLTSTTLQAFELDRTLQSHDLASPSLVRTFHRRAAKVVEGPWTSAAGTDFAHPHTTGPQPTGTDLANRWLHRVHRAAHTSRPVADQALKVHSGMARPESLVTPAMILRVLVAARRSPAAPPTPPHRPKPVRPGSNSPSVPASPTP